MSRLLGCYYGLQLSLPDCNHFSTAAGALADLSDDISGVFPYLKAVLPRARFHTNVPALIFEYRGTHFALRSQRVNVSPVANEAEARRVMDWLVEIINGAWERRAEIEPDHRAPKHLKLLDVYRLLPGGNCRACGETACLAFAAKLAKGDADVAACVVLLDPSHEDRRRQLLDMVSDTDVQPRTSWSVEMLETMGQAPTLRPGLEERRP